MDPETYAKVIADSVSPLGHRLSTVEVRFPRFVLPQLLMHRQFSRSCESLRARPVKSKLEEVSSSPFVPVFAKNRRGMAAGGQLDVLEASRAKSAWLEAWRQCTDAAEYLAGLGVAKQWANRLLEPFAYQKAVLTATSFANFFRLRCADDAQPEICQLACQMRDALAASTPQPVDYEEWHLPYVPEETPRVNSVPVQRDISAARCARVSYTTHDGKIDAVADLALAARLRADGHTNPLEHQAKPMIDGGFYANLTGWKSYRRLLEQGGKLPNPEAE